MKGLFLFYILFIATALFSQSGSLKFDGVDDYIKIENSIFNNIDKGEFTIEAWIKRDDNNSFHNFPIIFSNRSSLTSGVLFYFKGGPNNSGSYLTLNISGIDYFIETDVFSYDCYHVAVTRKNEILTFYFNGDTLGVIETIGSIPSAIGTNKVLIGKDQFISTHFSELLGGIRIWKKALSMEEIADYQTETIAGNTEGLIGYWDFKYEPQQSLTDLTNNHSGHLGASISEEESDPIWLNYGSSPRLDLGNDTVASLPYIGLIQNPEFSYVTYYNQLYPNGFSFNWYYTYIFLDNGLLWAEASNECGTTYDTIEVKIESVIYLPNTFTPDGNSFNEELKPYIAFQVDDYHFTILNRDRQIVFESEDPNIGWNGTYNYSIAPTGVYIWIIQARDAYGKLQEHKGTVTLLR